MLDIMPSTWHIVSTQVNAQNYYYYYKCLSLLKHVTVANIYYIYVLGFPGVSVVKNSLVRLPMQKIGLIPGSGSSPWEGNGNLFQCSCLGNLYGQRSLVSFSPWGCRRVVHDLTTKQKQQYVLVTRLYVGYLIIIS